MGEAFFYHLTRAPLEVTLSNLIGKSQGRGWRVLVRGKDEPRLDWLDQKLWQGPDVSFAAHGRAGGAHDALQPVLLTSGVDNPNGAACLMVVDGADVTAQDVAEFERACVLFDGHDEAAVHSARVQWKTLTSAGCTAQYWSEDSGRWEKKAESSGG